MANISTRKVEQEYDAWEHICADAFDNPKRGAIAVVTAYFDESYNHPKAGTDEPLMYTVACYITTKENWKKSRKEWRIELAKKGLDHFHMNRFEWARSEVIAGRELSTKNPYYGWHKEDFDQLLDKLHHVINRKDKSGAYRLVAFMTEVLRTDFDETRPEELKNDPQCRSYYIFCVSNIMEAIARWADLSTYYDPIHYVFAGGANEGGNLERWFNYCWKHPGIKAHFRLGKGYSRFPYDTQYANDEPALQMADTAAYEFNKAAMLWVQRGFRDMDKSEMRRSLGSLARTDHAGWLFRKEELLQTYDAIIKHRRRFPA